MAPNRSINSLKGAAFGFAFGLVVSVLPIMMIEYRHPFQYLIIQSRSQIAVELLVTLTTTIAFLRCGLFLELPQVLHQEQPEASAPGKSATNQIRIRLVPILATMFLFFYRACAQLCLKLNCAQLPDSPVPIRAWLLLGLTFILLSALIVLSAVCAHPKADHGDKQLFQVSHPIFLGTLVYLIGTALSFTTWFPLLAVPGAFVSIVWYIRRTQGATIDDAEPPWRVVPFIY
jgi:hypothetical protein